MIEARRTFNISHHFYMTGLSLWLFVLKIFINAIKQKLVYNR